MRDGLTDKSIARDVWDKIRKQPVSDQIIIIKRVHDDQLLYLIAIESSDRVIKYIAIKQIIDIDWLQLIALHFATILTKE